MKIQYLFALITFISMSRVSFCQNPTDSVEVKYDNTFLYALIGSNGDTITPFAFISLNSIGSGLYIFDAYPEYRGSLNSIIDSGIVLDRDSMDFDLDDDQYHIFEGIINSKGEIIGGESFRDVEYVQNTNTPPLFMVQSQEEFEKTENYNFALANQYGEVISEFYFEHISSNGEILTGNIVTNEYFRTVTMNMTGEIIEIVYEELR